ncbi:hypothetical protein J1N35_029626 [Gossypium stocksii]|uniref:Reverse transcriptase zinc-binding domain-containing protein n=1 Tax=Gossypium stocksii TaxID=47602 RepID=A0A9D3V0E1_9ROSI|nr:hypothetical protein J1N35_029626 [Gossypium stocksii]
MSLCHKLEGIMNKFWWTNNKTLRGIHWSSWDSLCKPKCVGGVGFKNLFLFNKAILAKQVWRIFSQPRCLLAKTFKACYFPFTDILSARVGSYPSFTWRSICNARELIADGLVWRIGTGESINIWNDAWLPGREQNRVSAQHIMPNWTTVNQLIELETSTWKRELVYNLFDDDTVARILSIPISDGGGEDLRVWKHDGSGVYTVRSGYRVLNSAHLQVPTLTSPNEGVYISFYKALWSLDIPGKIKIHIGGCLIICCPILVI